MINEHTRFWTAALCFYEYFPFQISAPNAFQLSQRTASAPISACQSARAHTRTQTHTNRIQFGIPTKKRNQRIAIRPYRLGHFARHLYFLRAYDEFFVWGCVLLFGCLYFSFSNCIRYDKHTLSRMTPSLRSAVSVRGIGIHIPKQHKKTTGTSRAPERQRLYFACLST